MSRRQAIDLPQSRNMYVLDAGGWRSGVPHHDVPYGVSISVIKKTKSPADVMRNILTVWHKQDTSVVDLTAGSILICCTHTPKQKAVPVDGWELIPCLGYTIDVSSGAPLVTPDGSPLCCITTTTSALQSIIDSPDTVLFYASTSPEDIVHIIRGVSGHAAHAIVGDFSYPPTDAGAVSAVGAVGGEFELRRLHDDGAPVQVDITYHGDASAVDELRRLNEAPLIANGAYYSGDSLITAHVTNNVEPRVYHYIGVTHPTILETDAAAIKASVAVGAFTSRFTGNDDIVTIENNADVPTDGTTVDVTTTSGVLSDGTPYLGTVTTKLAAFPITYIVHTSLGDRRIEGMQAVVLFQKFVYDTGVVDFDRQAVYYPDVILHLPVVSDIRLPVSRWWIGDWTTFDYSPSDTFNAPEVASKLYNGRSYAVSELYVGHGALYPPVRAYYIGDISPSDIISIGVPDTMFMDASAAALGHSFFSYVAQLFRGTATYAEPDFAAARNNIFNQPNLTDTVTLDMTAYKGSYNGHYALGKYTISTDTVYARIVGTPYLHDSVQVRRSAMFTERLAVSPTATYDTALFLEFEGEYSVPVGAAAWCDISVDSGSYLIPKTNKFGFGTRSESYTPFVAHDGHINHA